MENKMKADMGPIEKMAFSKVSVRSNLPGDWGPKRSSPGKSPRVVMAGDGDE